MKTVLKFWSDFKNYMYIKLSLLKSWNRFKFKNRFNFKNVWSIFHELLVLRNVSILVKVKTSDSQSTLLCKYCKNQHYFHRCKSCTFLRTCISILAMIARQCRHCLTVLATSLVHISLKILSFLYYIELCTFALEPVSFNRTFLCLNLCLDGKIKLERIHNVSPYIWNINMFLGSNW